MSVYVDHAFAAGDWGRWTGGGHLQADTPEELARFARTLGLRPEWLQSKPGRPEKDHYDLDERGRTLALKRGAIPESRREGAHRRRVQREARRRNGTEADPMTRGAQHADPMPTSAHHAGR